MATFPRTPAVLRRFAAVFPGLSLPQDSGAMPPGALLKLQALDPELGLILSGEAPAELELAVVTGTWADAAETPQQRQDAAKTARIQEILAADPFPTQGHYEGEGDAATYVPGNPGNLTLQMELQSLDPALAQRLQAEAQPPAPAMHLGDAAVLQRFGYSTSTAA